VQDRVQEETPEQRPGADRTRLLLAGGLAAALVIAVVLITALRGSGPDREFASPPPRCIDAWNTDPAAVAFGRHQSGSHGYYEVQVLTLSNDGRSEVPPTAPGASCAVVFASSALDPEPVSAAQIVKSGAWTPLSRFSDFSRLAELQADAQSAYNAQITPEGTIREL
jgi:hypothetical protein